MKTAFVTGASGYIGSNLCRELLENGYAVRALVRPTSKLDALAGMPLEYIRGDLADRAALARGIAGADSVFHIGALFREARFGDEEYWKVNLEGTRNVLEVSRELGAGKVIHCSTTGVLGHIANPPADENTPYAPLDVYQESKTEAEKLALQWFREGRLKGCVSRPAMVWGPGDRRTFKLFNGIYHRKLPIVGSGATLCHWILIHDLVRAFRLAAETERSNGALYIIAGERVVTLEHSMRTIAGIYGVRLLPFKIPVWPIQMIGSAVEAICKPFGIEPPIHRRRADFFIKSRAFDVRKAKEDLDFTAQHTFEEDAEIAARWYLANGWL